MNHADLISYTVRLAHYHGLITHYCSNSLLCDGNRGMPDLVIISPSGNGILWAEIKTDNAPDLSSDQTVWKYSLQANGAWYVILMPLDKDTGKIDAILRGMK